MHFAFLSLALAPPTAPAMYRKGLRFGSRPVFRELICGQGLVESSGSSVMCQYAQGEHVHFSGRLVSAQPAEANGPLSPMHGGIAIVRRGSCSLEEKMRNCVAAGASGVVLVNTEDSRFLAAPGEGVPFVCVSSSDGASLRPGASASISPLPLAHGTPLFPLTQPLLPGASSPLQISQAEQESLLAHTGQPGPSVEVATVLCDEGCRLAEVGTAATLDLSGLTGGGVATLRGVRPCYVRSLLREGTPDEVAIALTAEVDPAGADDLGASLDALCDALEVGREEDAPLLRRRAEDGVPLSVARDPEGLSFALCDLIALSALQAQAALELSSPERLAALSAQLARNPTRGRELLQQAAKAGNVRLPPSSSPPPSLPRSQRRSQPSMSAAAGVSLPPDVCELLGVAGRQASLSECFTSRPQRCGRLRDADDPVGGPLLRRQPVAGSRRGHFGGFRRVGRRSGRRVPFPTGRGRERPSGQSTALVCGRCACRGGTRCRLVRRGGADFPACRRVGLGARSVQPRGPIAAPSRAAGRVREAVRGPDIRAAGDAAGGARAATSAHWFGQCAACDADQRTEVELSGKDVPGILFRQQARAGRQQARGFLARQPGSGRPASRRLLSVRGSRRSISLLGPFGLVRERVSERNLDRDWGVFLILLEYMACPSGQGC